MTFTRWCHVLGAVEVGHQAQVLVQLFVGAACVPTPHVIKLGTIDEKIWLPRSAWGHIFVYDQPQPAEGYAGAVHEAVIEGQPGIAAG